MSKNISVGQKLYHFAYGPLTVTKVSHEHCGDYVETVVDIPVGGKGTGDHRKTWILETIGSWLFEDSKEVGNENDNFDWKRYWPDAKTAQGSPVLVAKDKSNWHPFFSDGDASGASPVGVVGSTGASPVGVVGNGFSDGASPVGVRKSK